MCKKSIYVLFFILVLVLLEGEARGTYFAAYWDGNYGTAWVGGGEGTRDILEAEGYEILDAVALKAWMDARIADGAASVVVFCRDAVPDTVAESMSATCTLRQYLDAGGKIVWYGDIPFWYSASAGAGNTIWGDAGARAILGFPTSSAPRGSWNHVTLTTKGIEWGLTETWQSERPASKSVVARENLTVLAIDNAGNAAAWVKHYGRGDHSRGFVRFRDTGGQANVDDIMRVAEYGTVGNPIACRPNPADGAIHAPTWIRMSWYPGDLAVSHDVYFGESFAEVYSGTGGTFQGNQPLNYFLVGLPGYPCPDGLVPGTTYYWRIDEVNNRHPDSPWKGDVWSFSIRTFARNTRPIEMKGVSYTAWQPTALLSEDSDRSLAKAREDGCDWIALCVWWFQDDVSSTSIEPDYTRFSATPESVVHAISQCHEQGMKVMLKPMVDCRDGEWRGNIDPSDEWFSAYQEFVASWAQIAEEYEVELFCIGCELTKTVSWSSSWRNIIQNTRAVYRGALTYAANHGNERNVGWWNDLDYIGIDAYYPLTNKNDPTLDELNRAWEDRANSIENWLNSVWPGKKVIFTEVGYQSVDGTNRTPWYTDPSSHTMDFPEQAECYEALLSVCRRRSWWSGAFWWNWETNPNGGGGNDPYWTPMNKPAENVMMSHYQNPPDSGYSPTEDFESGDFNTFDWITSGDEYWFITSDEFNTGNHSAQAGVIAHREATTLRLTLDCVAGDITFYRRVSSESGFDDLTFYIDGVEKGIWSGEEDWAEVSFPVDEGTRTFEWTYSKDSSVSDGDDTAWIDDIVFPIKVDLPVAPEPPDEPNTTDGFDLYLDYIEPNIENSSWFDEGILEYYSRDNPASGNFCIHWTGVGQYSAISFRFVPAKDLSVMVDEGYAIDFWVRCDSPSARIDIRFVDTKTNEPGDHPWRMRYTIDRYVADWNGEWNHLQIPLRAFSEHGSWDNGWYNPIGAYDWTATEHFEIVAEYGDLKGVHFYFDDIRVVGP